MSVIDSVLGKANKIATVIRPHLPMIGIAVGTVSLCAGSFITGRASLSVDDILEKHHEELSRTRRENNGLSVEEYSETKRKKDVVQIYGVTARRLVLHYAPGIVLASFGAACIFKSFGTLQKWHALALSAAAELSERFTAYRTNVVNELGEEADQRFISGSKEVEHKTLELPVSTSDEDEEPETRSFDAVTDLIEDDFTRILDYRSPAWESSFIMEDLHIREVVSHYTARLVGNRVDHVFMNTLFKEFGFEETGIGHLYGYTNNHPGCGVRIDVTPFVVEWDGDDDTQFPLYVTFETETDNEHGDWHFKNELDEDFFRQMYIEDDRKVGFILHFDVDTDENGIPKNIYDEVYNKHLLRK